MVAQPQREAIGKAARFGHLIGRQAARGHRHLQMFAGLGGGIGGIGQFEFGFVRQGTRGAAEHGLEPVKGRLICHDERLTPLYRRAQHEIALTHWQDDRR